MGETLNSPNLGGSLVTSTAQGSSVGLDVNVISSSASSLGSVWEMGLSNYECIRKAAGSPAVNYVFTNRANSFLVQNLGSSPIYFNVNDTANVASEGTAFLQANDGLSFNHQAGSLSIQGSGLTSPQVQVLRLS